MLELDEWWLPEGGVVGLAEKGGDGGGEVGETWVGDRCCGGAGGGGAGGGDGVSGGGAGDTRRRVNEPVTPSVLGVVVKNTGNGIGGVGGFGIAIAVE